jgi:hypothetical protein
VAAGCAVAVALLTVPARLGEAPTPRLVPADGGGGAPAGTPQAAPAPPDPPPAARYVDGPPRDADGRRWPPPAGRIPTAPTAPGEHGHATRPARISPGWVSGLVAGEQLVVADGSLPWTWWLDPAVLAVADEQVVRGAVAAWDGIPGSRWATAFGGVAAPGPALRPDGSASGGAVADGRSTLFLEPACEELTTANTYVFGDGGLGVDRYGTRVSQVVEADIGICPRAVEPTALRLALVHEVGHVLGMAHLCDPGDGCWEPGMGDGPHGCRVMFWQARDCQQALADEDRVALAELYPRLRPLWGPTPVDAAARAAFATWPDGSAPAAVALHPDVGGPVAAAAAVLAARSGGPLLVVEDDPQGCVAGAGAHEASRALRRRGTLVLVGPWPDVCERTAHDWEVALQRVATGPGDAAAGAAVARLAALGPPAAGAVLWTGPATAAPGVGPDLVAAAATAAAAGVPLLVDAGAAAALAGDVVVAGHQPAEGLAALVAAGGAGGRVLPADPVAGLLDAAGPPGAGDRPVVVVAAGGGAHALAGVPVAAERGGVVLLSGPGADPRVLAWLEAAAPPTGWVVGADDLPTAAARAAYGAALRS